MASTTKRTRGEQGRARPAPSGEATGTEGLNVAVLRGHLSSDPSLRALPSGEVLHTYEVTVREVGQPAASIPVVLFGSQEPKGLSAGDEVLVVGRVRRRFFRSGGATASRTEVVADRIVPARRTATIRRALAAATERVAACDAAVDGGRTIA